jgi:WD40 repeat protein
MKAYKPNIYLVWFLMIVVPLLVSCSQFRNKNNKVPSTLQQTQPSIPSENVTATSNHTDPKGINSLTVSKLLVSRQVTQSGAVSFTWLPDGGGVAVASNVNLDLLNFSQGKSFQPTNQIPVQTPNFLITSEIAKMIAWAGRDNYVHLWNITKKEEMTAIGDGTQAITGVAFSPVASSIAVAALDRKITVWDTATLQETAVWETPDWLSNLSFSTDGSQVEGTDLANFSVYFLDSSTGQEVQQLRWSENASPALYAAILSPDWHWIAWVSRGVVQLMDTSNGSFGSILIHEDFVGKVAWSPDSRLLATSAGATVEGQFLPVIYFWDIQTGQLVRRLIQDEVVIDMEFSPDGHNLAVLLASGTLKVWSFE